MCLAMACKHDWQSSYRLLSPAAITTSWPSFASSLLPITGASRNRPPRVTTACKHRSRSWTTHITTTNTGQLPHAQLQILSAVQTIITVYHCCTCTTLMSTSNFIFIIVISHYAPSYGASLAVTTKNYTEYQECVSTSSFNQRKW